MKTILKVLVILLFSVQITFSCSCFYEPMSVKKINHYNLVFKGKVLSKEKVGDVLSSQDSPNDSNFKMEYYKYTFEVIQSINFIPNTLQTIVYSSTQGSSCGVNYIKGDELFIFSYKVNGINMTGLCANNIFVNKADKHFKRVVDQYLKPKQRSIWKDEKCVLAAEGKFANGKPNGLWTYYNSDGTIQSKGSYAKGLKEGVWLSYLDEKGSFEYYSQLNEDQKLKVKNSKNIIDQQEIYKNGEKIKMKHRFILGGS